MIDIIFAIDFDHLLHVLRLLIIMITIIINFIVTLICIIITCIIKNMLWLVKSRNRDIFAVHVTLTFITFSRVITTNIVIIDIIIIIAIILC